MLLAHLLGSLCCRDSRLRHTCACQDSVCNVCCAWHCACGVEKTRTNFPDDHGKHAAVVAIFLLGCVCLLDKRGALSLQCLRKLFC